MATSGNTSYCRRVYPLDAHQLTEEQIAVSFAMTSRRPEPFDEIARQVSQEKAANFHERWVLGYGHASVAEHAVAHLAVENISRIACDALEDNRLASYTEKSSRYQVMPTDYFHVPKELHNPPEARRIFCSVAAELFASYQQLIKGCRQYLQSARPRKARDKDAAYDLRLRRIAAEACRAVLPAATLTNVGVTANARVLERAIAKLLSSPVVEEQELGLALREQGRRITPTLIKYAEKNPYLAKSMPSAWQLNLPLKAPAENADIVAKLVHAEPQAEERLAAALIFSRFAGDYADAWRQALEMSPEERQRLIDLSAEDMGEHDAAPREFEVVDYAFELLLDYGAYREYKRHRMQSCFPQPLSVSLGYRTPKLLCEAGLTGQFQEAIGRAEEGYRLVSSHSPLAAQYLVTHAHYRRVLVKLNLRECYHLFKLRTSMDAHESLRDSMLQAMRLAVATHPGLFHRLRLRSFPDWWPFPQQP